MVGPMILDIALLIFDGFVVYLTIVDWLRRFLECCLLKRSECDYF